ncbi:MAG: G5 domain-containing protein, partial [Firmicutes bacterium]|nr:G5 domain-containing protein [Bacillota bacterium]
MAKKTRGMVLALSTMLTAAVMSVTASSADSMKIRLTTDGQSTYYQTIDKTVGEFFKNNKLAYGENYKISADLDTALKDGMQITVVSPKKITVSAKGGSKKFTVETQCETIGQLMLELKKNTGVGYKTAEGRSSSEKLKDGETVELREIKEEIYTETEEVPFSRVEEKTEDLYEGETKVVQQGVTGKKLITMKTVFYDDVQVDNYCIERKVVAEPVNEK